MTTSLSRCNHNNSSFTRLRLVPRETDAVAVVVPNPSRRPKSMSPNYYREQMCEAKMDPESPLSDDVSKAGTGLVPNGTVGRAEVPDHEHVHSHPDPALTPKSELEEEDEDMEDDLSSDDMISVGGSPSPSPSSENNHTISRHPDNKGDEYFRPLKKLRMVQQVETPSSQTPAGLKSFSISDILSHKPAKSSSTNSSSGTRGREVSHGLSQQRIVRPWDYQQQQQQQQHQRLHHAQGKTNGRRASSDSSPLDALFQMTSKTFEGLNGHHESSEMGGGGNSHQMFNSRQPPKKKRKSRTAFTNHQIFELEKRFLYQKYLSPADRDDIAQQLGLTNAQVITWFQNRRAKLKRDMEELKKDMESAKILSAHKSFLESAHDLGLLKKRAQNQMDMNSAAAAASFHMSSPTSSSQSSHSPINLTSESPPSTH